MDTFHTFARFTPRFVRRRLTRVRATISKALGQDQPPDPTASSQPARLHARRNAGVSQPGPATASARAPGQVNRRSRKNGKRITESSANDFTARDLCDYLGVSPATISNLRRDRKIYGYRPAQGVFAYPKAQLVQGGNKRKPRVIEGVDQVLAHFGDTDTAWSWITTEQDGVGTRTRPTSTPLDELRRGRLKPVLSQLPSQQQPH